MLPVRTYSRKRTHVSIASLNSNNVFNRKSPLFGKSNKGEECPSGTGRKYVAVNKTDKRTFNPIHEEGSNLTAEGDNNHDEEIVEAFAQGEKEFMLMGHTPSKRPVKSPRYSANMRYVNASPSGIMDDRSSQETGGEDSQEPVEVMRKETTSQPDRAPICSPEVPKRPRLILKLDKDAAPSPCIDYKTYWTQPSNCARLSSTLLDDSEELGLKRGLPMPSISTLTEFELESTLPEPQQDLSPPAAKRPTLATTATHSDETPKRLTTHADESPKALACDDSHSTITPDSNGRSRQVLSDQIHSNTDDVASQLMSTLKKGSPSRAAHRTRLTSTPNRSLCGEEDLVSLDMSSISCDEDSDCELPVPECSRIVNSKEIVCDSYDSSLQLDRLDYGPTIGAMLGLVEKLEEGSLLVRQLEGGGGKAKKVAGHPDQNPGSSGISERVDLVYVDAKAKFEKEAMLHEMNGETEEKTARSGAHVCMLENMQNELRVLNGKGADGEGTTGGNDAECSGNDDQAHRMADELGVDHISLLAVEESMEQCAGSLNETYGSRAKPAPDRQPCREDDSANVGSSKDDTSPGNSSGAQNGDQGAGSSDEDVEDNSSRKSKSETDPGTAAAQGRKDQPGGSLAEQKVKQTKEWVEKLQPGAGDDEGMEAGSRSCGDGENTTIDDSISRDMQGLQLGGDGCRQGRDGTKEGTSKEQSPKVPQCPLESIRQRNDLVFHGGFVEVHIRDEPLPESIPHDFLEI